MPKAVGGFSEVWKADNPDSTDGVVFALKVLRVTLQDNFLEIKKVRASYVSGPPISNMTFRDSARKCWLPNMSNMKMS
jgi:hypothetical protein